MTIGIIDYSVAITGAFGQPNVWARMVEGQPFNNQSISHKDFDLLDQLIKPLLPVIRSAAAKTMGITVSQSKYQFPQFDQRASFFQALPDAFARHIALQLDGECVLYPVSAACATGLLSVIKGVELLNRGVVDLVIAGSLESSRVPLMESAFKALGVISSTATIRPFDQERNGFLIGEGGALFVLVRKADYLGPLKAELKSTAYGADAFQATRFEAEGRSIQHNLERLVAFDSSQCPDYVNAHGTGTVLNDRIEARALERVFGTGSKPMINSTKSYTGHLLGATGSVELALGLLQMEQGVVLPNLNLKDPITALNLPDRAIKTDIESFISMNFGFGGPIASVWVSQP